MTAARRVRPSPLLTRAVAREFSVLAVSCLAAVVVIFLVVDFADRARIYRGPGWQAAVAELYAAKVLVVGYQLLPAALVLAAALAASALRRRNELTALMALGLGRWAVAGPVLAVTLVATLAAGAVWDRWGVRAAVRADEIMVHRFARYGDWGMYHRSRRWFREGNRIFALGAGETGAFRDVSVFELDGRFRLARRTDAARLERVPGESERVWRLVDVVQREFRDGALVSEEHYAERRIAAPGNGDAFRVRAGRPREMRFGVLAEQVRIREELGLPVREYVMELHAKVAQPLSAVPAVIVALALALRPGRKGHSTVAIVEGLVVVFGLWAVSVVARSLALHGIVPSAWGAWASAVTALVAAVGAWRWTR